MTFDNLFQILQGCDKPIKCQLEDCGIKRKHVKTASFAMVSRALGGLAPAFLPSPTLPRVPISFSAPDLAAF